MLQSVIIQKILTKETALKASQETSVSFTLCGTRCRIWYGSDTAVHYGYKRPLMNGYESVTIEHLTRYIDRFQF